MSAFEEKIVTVFAVVLLFADAIEICTFFPLLDNNTLDASKNIY